MIRSCFKYVLWLSVLAVLSGNLQAQKLSLDLSTVSNDIVFGSCQFHDSFILVASRTEEQPSFFTLRVLSLNGKVLKQRNVNFGGAMLVGTRLFRAGDHYFVVYRTDYGKPGNYLGDGIMKFNQCLEEQGSLTFYAESETLQLYDLCFINDSQVVATALGVADNHATLLKINHNSWTYQASHAAFRTIRPVLRSFDDGKNIFVSGYHYVTEDGIKYYRKLGVHKFDEDLNLLWYKSYDQHNRPNIADQINYIDGTGSPMWLWGTSRRVDQDVPTVFQMDSVGRIWDSIDLEGLYGSVVTGALSIKKSNTAVVSGSYLGIGQNEFIKLVAYENELLTNRAELELVNPNGSNQVHRTFLYSLDSLFGSYYLVTGTTENPGSKQFDGFCTCYTPDLDTCNFVSSESLSTVPCLSDLDSITTININPTLSSSLTDSSFVKSIEQDDFVLNSTNVFPKRKSCSITPNPANTHIIVEVDQTDANDAYLVTVLTSTGIEAYKNELTVETSGELSLELPDLSAGYYFIKLKSLNHSTGYSCILVKP